MTSLPVSPAEAATELLIRRKARADPRDYAAAIDIPGKPVTDDPDAEIFQPVETRMAAHHRLMLSRIEAAMLRPYGRLMLLMPPGSGKSSYASVVMPSRFLGARPGARVILTGYGDDLPRKMGRRIRSIIKQARYRGIWNAELSKDSSAADEFSLTNGSEFMAAGILSGITGNRAHVLLIDDPVKGREQANSEVIRQKTWDAYVDDALTRLVPGGSICMTLTHWHQDDIAGRILPEDWRGESGMIACRDGNTWEVLCLQARCEVENDPLGRQRGEYLWPEWFTREHWAQFEGQSRTWQSLFQQVPSPDEGDLFKVEMLGVIDALPAGRIEWVRGWDLGATTEGDWTVGAKLGRMSDGRFVIGDMVRIKQGPHLRDHAIVHTAQEDGHGARVSLPQDPGQAGIGQVLYLTSRLAGYTVHSSPETGDKVVRAEPFAAQVNVGNVVMLRGHWNKATRDVLRLFPNGTYDDDVDALSRAFSLLVSKLPMNVSTAALELADYSDDGPEMV